MAKFHGNVGYVSSVETAPGVYSEVPTEYPYYGDIIRDAKRSEDSGKVNEGISVGNQISIVADTYAYQNFHSMRYVVWMNVSWEITSVEVRRPRLILTLGGVYNGN